MPNSGPIVKYGFMDDTNEERLILWDLGVFMYLFTMISDGNTFYDVL
jgi:hypothetical protein